MVTGAANGIGAATGRLFVREGARVVIADVDRQGGERLAAELGASATFAELDVSQPTAWRAAVDLSKTQFGSLNILVNNAGYHSVGSLQETSEEDFDRHVAVNQRGVFLGMRSVLDMMARAGGARSSTYRPPWGFGAAQACSDIARPNGDPRADPLSRPRSGGAEDPRELRPSRTCGHSHAERGP